MSLKNRVQKKGAEALVSVLCVFLKEEAVALNIIIVCVNKNKGFICIFINIKCVCFPIILQILVYKAVHVSIKWHQS